MKNLLFLLLFISLSACWDTTSTTNKPTDPKEKPTATNNGLTTKNTPNDNASSRSIDQKWLCIPGKQVGMISAHTTEESIKMAYGKENVIRRTIGVGEGETIEGTVVFPNSNNEISIEWATDRPFERPTKVRIQKGNTPWKTDQNISIGTTLSQLQRINGKDFKFAGFEWDYAGYTQDWQGGKINPDLTIFLEAGQPEAAFPDLLGDELFLSSHPKAVAADLRVRAMVIEL